MNCQETDYILDTHRPGELHAGQKRAVDRHIASCRACREAWEAYRELSALQIPETPQGLHSRIVTALTSIEAHPVRRSLVVGSLLVVGAAVAATVALRVTDGGSEVSRHSVEPAPVAPDGSPVTQRSVPVSANRVDVAVSVDSSNETSDATGSRSGHPLDPNTIVVLPVPHPELDPRRAALLARFHEEILGRLMAVPGLNVARPELVDPFLYSGIPEEQVARDLGAGQLVVLSTTSDPSARMTITHVDMTTGNVAGSMMVLSPFDAKWPAELTSDAASVVDFIEEGLTPIAAAQRQAAVADARAIVLNAALPTGRRVEALGRLPQSPEGRNDAVVAAAVELATIAPQLRASIWRAMYGVDDPYLIEPLLNSLAYDSADHRRRAAAEALGTFIDEPSVRTALERAQANDASPAVRKAARYALSTDEARDQLALQRLLDETLPARERLFATRVHTGRFVRAVPLTDEAARAVFDIGAGTTDPEIRAMAWGSLGRSRVDDPAFRAILLDDLANHKSDSVRRMAAVALTRYTDHAAVRAALERAESDPSFEVRLTVRSVLGKVPD